MCCGIYSCKTHILKRAMKGGILIIYLVKSYYCKSLVIPPKCCKEKRTWRWAVVYCSADINIYAVKFTPRHNRTTDQALPFFTKELVGAHLDSISIPWPPKTHRNTYNI